MTQTTRHVHPEGPPRMIEFRGMRLGFCLRADSATEVQCPIGGNAGHIDRGHNPRYFARAGQAVLPSSPVS